MIKDQWFNIYAMMKKDKVYIYFTYFIYVFKLQLYNYIIICRYTYKLFLIFDLYVPLGNLA